MKIVVTGAGLIGLSTAVLLARDGHQVTVLERDAAPVPDPAEAWDDWERRGVTQARLPHLFAPRFRTELEAELPDVATALVDAGALQIDLSQNASAVWGDPRPGDEDFIAVTGRRIVFESVLAGCAEETPGVDVRRGCAVAGLLAGPDDPSGVPSVVGVRLESGDELRADLVVDATGRRSPVPTWLEALGAAPPAAEADDSGFVYYGRHFRSADGSLPEMQGVIPLSECGSISLLTLPADNGTWSTTIIASSEDTAIRGIRDIDRWNAVVRSLPNGEAWIDGEPLEDRIMSISKIEDRSRSLVVDGKPVVTGLFLVGDSWACTNPSVGRGASIGLVHAIGLRDVLRAQEDSPPVELSKAWDDTTNTLVTPWYRSTVNGDRHRLAEIRHAIAGETYASDDPNFEMGKSFLTAASRDPDCARALFRIAGVYQLPEQVLATEGLFEKVIEFGADWRDHPVLGPTRDELVALANG